MILIETMNPDIREKSGQAGSYQKPRPPAKAW
jgi:hypothetical protein